MIISFSYLLPSSFKEEKILPAFWMIFQGLVVNDWDAVYKVPEVCKVDVPALYKVYKEDAITKPSCTIHCTTPHITNAGATPTENSVTMMITTK